MKKILYLPIFSFFLLFSTAVQAKSDGPVYYRSAVEANGFLFVSGQNAQKGDESLKEYDISEQTKRALDQIGETLKANGYSFDDVVSVNIFLAKQSDFAEFNKVYQKYFPKRPARSVAFGVLHQDIGALVEVLLVAYKKEN